MRQIRINILVRTYSFPHTPEYDNEVMCITCSGGNTCNYHMTRILILPIQQRYIYIINRLASYFVPAPMCMDAAKAKLHTCSFALLSS